MLIYSLNGKITPNRICRCFDRNEAIQLAYRSGGYTLEEIGKYYALHYSTVSRIIHRDRQNERPDPDLFGNWEQSLAEYANKQLNNGTVRLLDITTPIYESIMIKAALKKTGGKKKEAADLLGLGRNTLTRKISELDIS